VNSFWVASYFGYANILKLLNDTGKVDIANANELESNSMHISAKRNNKECVKYLLEIKFPINEIKPNGTTAVSLAAYNGHKEIVQLLIDGGADINTT
jgi:ankyrin repeat protein